MLVLGRKQDETVVVCTEPHVYVTVLGIRGDKVRLGFSAAPGVKIHRQEVYEAIKREDENGCLAGP